jgi:hypothetical protein
MKKTEIGFLTLASVFVMSVFGTTSALAYSLPDITPSGSPAFTNNVRVHLNPNGMLRIMGRANQTFLLDTGSGTMVGTGGMYTLTASFTETGDYIEHSGFVKLYGMMSQVGITQPHTFLMSADLTSANLVDDPYLWGFNTSNIVCNADLLLECTNSESVYVALSNAFSGDFGRNFMSMGIAVTTVPVPAAVWLFGSALGLLGWARRRTISGAAAA